MDLNLYIKAFAALLLVLGLIVACSFLLRYVRRIQKSSMTHKELSCSEILVLSTNAKVVVVERKGVKYLLLIGSNHNLVIDIIDEN